MSNIEQLNAEVQESLDSPKKSLDPRICAFCKSAFGKYSCPRCEQLYCSLGCYKSKAHRACSSTFYRDSAQATAVSSASKVTDDSISDADRRKLLELVNEYELDAQERPFGDLETLVDRGSDGPDSDDDEEEAQDESDGSEVQDEDDQRRKDLEERMTGVDIESAEFDELWSRLTVDEQADFIRLAREHELHAGEVL